MEKNSKVSVIVPVYNEETYLTACVDSICAQHYQNLEIILIDDGSTNKAGKICDELGKMDSRIIVIHQKNAGLSAARTAGLKQAAGDWIMFADHDDIVSPYIVADFSRYFKDDSVDIIAGRRMDMKYPEKHEWKHGHQVFTKEYGIDICKRIYQDRQKSIITPLWGKIYRKRFLDRINLEKYKPECPTIYFEDILVTPLLYYYANQIVLLTDIYYVHRDMAGSISNSMKLSSFYYEQIQSGHILLQFYRKKKLDHMYKDQLCLYMHTILRLACLTDDDHAISAHQKQEIKKSVQYRYHRYKKDYFMKGNESAVRKFIIFLYSINSELWIRTVRSIYYKRCQKRI